MKDTGFISDFSVDGMMHAVIIRSPVACGSLIGIDCPKLPNLYSLITAEDIPAENSIANFSVPVLAAGKLSYIGQPIAILTGPDEFHLREITTHILPRIKNDEPSSNEWNGAIVSRNIASGNMEDINGEEGQTVSGIYTTGIQEHWYSEPHGALAVPNEKADGITIYTATQWSYHVKRSVASVIGWDIGKVNVIPTLMMLHFDGKLWYPSLLACHAALAAKITGSPVKLMLKREEDFMFSPKRNRSEIKIRSKLGENGEILGSELQLKLDLGAQNIFEDEIIDHTCLGALGLYKRKAFKIDAASSHSKIPPQGPMSGFGLSQGLFAVERHISLIADTLGVDPAEWRKENFLSKGQGFEIGINLKGIPPLVELVDKAAKMSDYHRKWASYELIRNRRKSEEWVLGRKPLRGIGISVAFQGNGFLYGEEYGTGSYTVELTLEKDGGLEIKSSIPPFGRGYSDSCKKLALDILGVDPSLVRFSYDTQEAPDSGPETLSRSIVLLTRLIERCCTAIRNQRFRDPLPITVKRSTKTSSIPNWAPGKKMDPEAFSQPGYGVAVTEIEIDPVSFEPLIRGIWMAVDGGSILNRDGAVRALRIACILALGWTCREQLGYEDGKIPLDYYRGYDIPAPRELPSIKVDFLKNDAANPKGIGQLPFSCVPAAYSQAVSQALDHHFDRLPLDSRDIWDAWRQKHAEISP